MRRCLPYTQQYCIQEKRSGLLHWLFFFPFFFSFGPQDFKYLHMAEYLCAWQTSSEPQHPVLGASASSDHRLIPLSLPATVPWCPLIVRLKCAGRQNSKSLPVVLGFLPEGLVKPSPVGLPQLRWQERPGAASQEDGFPETSRLPSLLRAQNQAVFGFFVINCAI